MEAKAEEDRQGEETHKKILKDERMKERKEKKEKKG